MGGKSSTTTQKVTIPPEVMERYRSVNTRAEGVANTPFQQYSTNPSDFVAPINQTQQQGIQNIGNVQNAALPFYGAGANLTMGGAGSVGRVSGDDINYYMSPYLNSVVGATLGNLAQEQGIQRQEQIGNAIRSGAFGGDRAGLAQANLARQQGMAYGSTAANLLNQGYGQALGAAQAYQGVEANNLARQLQAGQQIAGLGSGLTQTQLQAGQALLGAGTAQQQTDQAGLSALYNQFQQERSYPFQVSQFLANIAMGTGALSGSTTTTQQPVPFFSDPRLKENMQEIGQTHDGLPIYKYNLKGHPGETQIGLNADEVEQMKPEAVGLAGGYKTVDYDAATRPRGGLDPAESMGGAVVDLEPHEYRENFAAGGGMPNFEAQLAQLYAQFGSPHGAQPGGGLAGPYGGRASYVPQASLPVGQLKTAGKAPKLPDSIASQVMSTGREFGITPKSLYSMGESGLGYAKSAVSAAAPPAAPVQLPSAARSQYDDSIVGSGRYARGGLAGYADGGDVEDPMKSYGAQQGGLNIPTEQPDIKPLNTPTGMPGAPKSVMSDIMDVGKFAASLFAMSDERMKDGMQRVGQLDNGLPVYKYSIGDGPTQIGLSAQEAGGLHPGAAMADDRGILHLDYDRATRAHGGGLMPRMGYQAGGVPSQYREYVEEASRETGIPVPILAAKIQQEGQWRPDAEGRAGEIGMSQVLPSTARRPGFGVAPVDPEMLRQDPREQIMFGARYLRGRGDAAGVENWSDYSQAARALRAYNGGGDPNYVQNVFRHLPRFGVEGVSAYAGQPQRSEASGAINQTAGQPAGLGRAAPTRSQEPSRAEEKGLIASMLPTKFGTRTVENPKGEQFGGLGEFLTSRQFIQPLLEGVGAMASSPSLYAGGAFLQGLGAASRAYTGLEKEVAGTLTEAEQARSQVAGQTSTLSNIPNDRLVMGLGPNGRPVVATKGEMERMMKSGKRITDIKEAPPGSVPTSETSGTDGKPAQGAPGTTDASRPQPPITMDESGRYTVAPTPEFVDRELMKIPAIATQVAASGGKFEPEVLEYAVLASPSLASTNESARKKFTDLSNSVTDINQKIFDLRKYTQEIAKISEGTVTGSGASFDPRIAAARIYDTTARILGLGGLSDRERQDLTSAEITNKLRNLMSSDVAKQAGQRAFGMFEAINSALPSGEMTKDAALDLMSAMLAQAQKNKDLLDYQTNYRNRYGVLIESERLFNQQSAKYYDDVRKSMKKAFTGVRIGGTDRSPQIVNPAQLLIDGKISAKGFDRHMGLPGLSRILTEN